MQASSPNGSRFVVHGLMLQQRPPADNTSLTLLYSLTTIEHIESIATPGKFMRGPHLLQSYETHRPICTLKLSPVFFGTQDVLGLLAQLFQLVIRLVDTKFIQEVNTRSPGWHIMPGEEYLAQRQLGTRSH